MCELSARAWYLIIVSFWLLLTIARQAFDLIGKLWIPVAINLVQILVCITGLFAAVQWRFCLIALVMLFGFISIAYNVALSLWYNEYFGSRDQLVLSAGLPYSHSFFLRYTPSCKSYFNLTSLHWVQSACPLPYYHIESAQAFVHIFLSFCTVILSITLICQQRRKKKKLADQKAKKLKMAVNNNTSRQLGKARHDYYNESYVSGEHELPENDRQLQTTRPVNGYVRQSGKRPLRKAVRAAEQSNNQALQEAKKNTGHDSCTTTAENITPQQREGGQSCSSRASDSPSRSGSLRSFKMPTTEGVRRMMHLEEDEVVQDDRHMDTKHNNYEPRDQTSNLTSLISFDPKSKTLIRVQEHIDDSGTRDEAYQVSISQQQRQREDASRFAPNYEASIIMDDNPCLNMSRAVAEQVPYNEHFYQLAHPGFHQTFIAGGDIVTSDDCTTVLNPLGLIHYHREVPSPVHGHLSPRYPKGGRQYRENTQRGTEGNDISMFAFQADPNVTSSVPLINENSLLV